MRFICSNQAQEFNECPTEIWFRGYGREWLPDCDNLTSPARMGQSCANSVEVLFDAS
jgi:hypothetical protein